MLRKNHNMLGGGLRARSAFLVMQKICCKTYSSMRWLTRPLISSCGDLEDDKRDLSLAHYWRDELYL